MENACWYSLIASTARFFRVGEVLEKGTYLGDSPYGMAPLWTSEAASVAGVQYDISSDMVVVGLMPVVVPEPLVLA